MKLFIAKIILYFGLILTCKQAFCCVFSGLPESEDTRVVNINGRTIYTFSRTHLSEKNPNKIFNAFRKSDPAIKLNEILVKEEHLIKQTQSVVRQITTLAASGQIDWLGIEVSPEELDQFSIESHTNKYLEIKQAVDQHLGNNDQWDKQKTDRILHLMFLDYIIAIAENPETFRNIPVIPLENHQVKSESINVMKRTNEHYDSFLDSVVMHMHTEPANMPTMTRNLRDLKRGVRLGEIDDQELERLLNEKFKNEEIRSAARNYLFDMKRVFFPGGDLFEKRNDRTAARILALSGNGLVIMGISHRPGIESRLTDSCKKNP